MLQTPNRIRTPLLASVLAVAFLATLVPAPAAAFDVALMGAWWEVAEIPATAGGVAGIDENGGDAAGFGARVSFNVSRATMIDISVFYFEELEQDDLDNPTNILDSARGGTEIIPIDLGMRYGKGPFKLGGGITYFNIDAPPGRAIDDEIGWYAKIAYEFGKADTRFFVEGMYREVDSTIDPDTNETRDEIDLDLGGIQVNLGIMFTW